MYCVIRIVTASNFLVDSVASIFAGVLVIADRTLPQHPKRRNAVGDAIILISLRSIRRRICASRMETSNENTRESMRRRKSGEERITRSRAGKNAIHRAAVVAPP